LLCVVQRVSFVDYATRDFVLGAAVAAAACGPSMSDSGATDPGNGQAAIRVVNASQGLVDVIVDGQTVTHGLQVATVSDRINVSSGNHQIRLASPNGPSAQVQIDAATGATRVAVVTPAASSLSASVLADTGAIVPAGKTKLRVAHLAANAGSIEIWRTQPDFQTPVHIMTPFDYQATSPYLQSDPGAWEVFVTRPGTTLKARDDRGCLGTGRRKAYGCVARQRRRAAIPRHS
jgi:hypothetical protein